ncbi:MAG TPA: hypothetical protein VNA12_03065 [Mycobacteriales bacterium]|nr:hypothetical protein [Mycobacteriales bacterium]
MRTARRALAAGLGLALLTGCGFSTTGLSFSDDDRLEILEPEDREQLRLPVTIDWTIDDFEVTGPGRGSGDDEGYFAIFVDQAPVPSGKTLRHVARKDKTCRPADGCPDEEYLAARQVFTTTETRYVLETLPRTAREGRREFHEITVVLLDADGRRIGESAWYVRFELKRDVR